MAYEVNANKFKPGTRILIKGQVLFSHISRLTTDEERTASNQRKAEKIKAKNPNARIFEEKTNYTYITLSNIQPPIVLERVNGNTEQAAPDVTDLGKKYVSERSYQNKNGDWCFQAVSKNPILPVVLVPNPEKAGATYEKQVNCRYLPATNDYGPSNPDREWRRLDGELQVGLNVTIELRIFDSNKGNNGVALDRVVVHEPLQLYRPSATRRYDDLKFFGFTEVTPPPTNENVVYAESPANATEIGYPEDTADPFDSESSVFGNTDTPATEEPNGRFIGAGDHAPEPSKKKGPF